MTERAHVYVEGRVQGVGFRYALLREAHQHNINGWARNLPDGRVEAEFEGAKKTVQEMVVWCQQGPAFAHVTNVDVRWETGEAKHQGFRIVG